VSAVTDVLFIDDVARELRTSRTTIARLRRQRLFPIPELPSIDKRPRWSRAAVDQYLAGERAPKRSPLKLASR
jgi:predicted DNA-binding transcriptional regulator AlpA